jgi:hypothetical protein
MLFEARHLKIEKPIFLENLHGYVLPHAGTEFTGDILSHTLRFRPLKNIKKVFILYYPAGEQPDVNNTDYHEYYVPLQAMRTVFQDKKYSYEGYNIRKGEMPDPDIKDALLVVSADFSHFLPMQEALDLENKAARALMFKELPKAYQVVVDNMETFKAFFALLPEAWQLQWVGRDRSAGLKAVGYLSFLLRETPPTPIGHLKTPIDGIFVTVYSKDMTARECQGKWFSAEKWSLRAETKLIKDVIRLGETTSRLTGGVNKEEPLMHYSITYLYKDDINPFIRGWHGVLYNAFYLPEVFLENTYKNGRWLTARDTSWPRGDHFIMTETLQHLKAKAGLTGGHLFKRKSAKKSKWSPLRTQKNKNKYRIKGGQKPYTLYSTRVVHYIV